MDELKNRVLSRYSLQNVTLRNSALHFFCLAEDPYKKAVDAALEESVQNALRKDLINVVGDFNRAYRKESCLVDVEQE